MLEEKIATQTENRQEMIEVPNWISDVFNQYLICEFTTISRGKPITFPLLFFYEPQTGVFTVTSSILFSKKVDHLRRNSKVSLLLSNSTGSGIGRHVILVQGIARFEDSDLDHGWERFLPYWRKKEPYIDGFLSEREKFSWFWKRIVVQVEPTKITAWKDANLEKPPEVFKTR